MLTGLSSRLAVRWRRRLWAGALALAFAGLSQLPWVHVLTAGGHDGHHGCCHHEAPPPGGSPAPALDDREPDAPDACWICDSLASLHHPDTPAELTAPDADAPSTSYAARPPHAPVFCPVYPASRAQAPPARL